MDINYELYKVFYYVAKTLSFSEAASELYISQSAVSQSIKVLEKRLGEVLFTRSTKRVALTKEGEMLFKHIEPAIHLINKGENQIFNARQNGSMQLRIGASDTICRYFLVEYLNEFHKAYPDVHIRVMNATSLKCADLLERSDVDFIITNSPNPSLNNAMHITNLCEFSDVFLANKNAYPYEMDTLSLEELAHLPILMLDKQSTTSEFLHGQFLLHSLDLAPAIELSSNDLLIDLAKIGLGIAFVPDYCANKRLENDLYILNIKNELPKRKLVLAYDDTMPLSEPANYFKQLLCGTLEK